MEVLLSRLLTGPGCPPGVGVLGVIRWLTAARLVLPPSYYAIIFLSGSERYRSFPATTTRLHCLVQGTGAAGSCPELDLGSSSPNGLFADDIFSYAALIVFT